MAVTTFNWKECKETDYHHETENIDSHGGIDASYEFWIHTNDVYELPSTGGMGTYWYTLGGVVLDRAGNTRLFVCSKTFVATRSFILWRVLDRTGGVFI